MGKFKFIKLFTIKGVPIFFHWSSIIILVLIIIAGISYIPTIIGGISIFALVLLHELGHFLMASRLGLTTNYINIYPLLGLCIYNPSYSDYKNYLVAWGGVLIQFLILIPCLIIYFVIGENLHETIRAFITIFGPLNLLIIILNLIPFPGLDGYTCWKIFSFKKKDKAKKNKKLKRKHENFKIIQ